MALKLGAAAGRYFRREGSAGHRVVIGKDTRLSGYMLENALTAGLTSTGMNVLLLGPVPTPAVGFLTRSMRADLGVMISAPAAIKRACITAASGRRNNPPSEKLSGVMFKMPMMRGWVIAKAPKLGRAADRRA
jgi:hypothetical protein